MPNRTASPARLCLLASVVGSIVALASGCATRPTETDRLYLSAPAQTETGDLAAQAAPASPAGWRPATATALVFDPPVTAYTPALNLDRSLRRPQVELGYDSGRTVTYTRLDDRQFYDGSNGGRSRGGSRFSGYVERQSVSETITIRQR